MALTRLRRGLIATIILAPALTGCGSAAPIASASVAPIAAATAGASAQAASPIPTPTPAPTPSPSPSIDVKAAGVAYLAMASKLATTLTPIFDELAARSHNEAEYVKLNQDAATAYRTAIKDLAAIEVPAELESDVAALSAVLDKLAKEFEHTVADTSYDNVAAYEALNPKVGEAGAAIRKALGLPPSG
jgi:biopolymer transport protein ExbD